MSFLQKKSMGTRSAKNGAAGPETLVSKKHLLDPPPPPNTPVWGRVEGVSSGLEAVLDDGRMGNKSPPVLPDIPMIEVRAGIFTMGSGTIAAPPHRVTLSRNFRLGVYAVTQEQWYKVMGTNPGAFHDKPAPGEVQERRPVECVSWYDAAEFCNKLSALSGLQAAYTITDIQRGASAPFRVMSANVTWDKSANGYRLPTEAEWEYAACEGGVFLGDSMGDDAAWGGNNSENPNDTYLNREIQNGVCRDVVKNRKTTHEVGKKQPNKLGFYDMCGNVEEWCWDAYQYPEYNDMTLGYDNEDAVSDPSGPPAGDAHICRGGYYARASVPAQRFCWDTYLNSLGFRVACGPYGAGDL